MRKLSLTLALLLVLLFAVSAAAEEAPSLEAFALSRGLSEADAAALAEMVAEVGKEMTEAEKRALLESFLGQPGALQGTVENDTYHSPLGFSCHIPQGFAWVENRLGAAILLEGPRDEKGFGQTIAIQVFAGEQPQFEEITEAELEPLFRQTLANYQFVSMDEFEMQGRNVREFVHVHGASEDEIRMQYQMFFNQEGKSFIITMTTLAEEVAHESALRIYDQFISELSFDGAPVPSAAPEPTATPGVTLAPEPTATAAPTTRPAGGQGNG